MRELVGLGVEDVKQVNFKFKGENVRSKLDVNLESKNTNSMWDRIMRKGNVIYQTKSHIGELDKECLIYKKMSNSN